MGGTIGVISDHAARYTWFHQSLAALEIPDGTSVEWKTGANRGTSRDAIVEAALAADDEWVFFVDDDEVLPADALTKLLAHRQPVVSALIVQRGHPFLPTAYVEKRDGQYLPLDLHSVSPGALVPCAGLGSGGLLVRTDVFRQVKPPWFLYTENYGEDLFFSDRCNEAGVPLFVDTDCRIGHILPAAVFATGPYSWRIGIQLADGTKANVPFEPDYRWTMTTVVR